MHSVFSTVFVFVYSITMEVTIAANASLRKRILKNDTHGKVRMLWCASLECDWVFNCFPKINANACGVISRDLYESVHNTCGYD